MKFGVSVESLAKFCPSEFISEAMQGQVTSEWGTVVFMFSTAVKISPEKINYTKGKFNLAHDFRELVLVHSLLASSLSLR